MLAWLAVVLLTACSGADDRPPPSGDPSQPLVPPSPPATSNDGESAPTGTASATGDVCPPRTKRECQLTYRLADGTTLDCGISVQWCRADGAGWLPCGRTRRSAHGEDIPPY